MRGAFGALHWTPETFWRSTVTEYMLAIEGFNEINGGGAGKKDDGPTDSEMAMLLKQYG